MASVNEINSIRNRMEHITTLERQMTATAAISMTERDRTEKILDLAIHAYESLREPAAAVIRQLPGIRTTHFLLKEPDSATATTAYLLMGTDRVLCGTHNEDILFETVKAKHSQDKLLIIGSQITDIAQSAHLPIIASFPSTSPEKTMTFAEFSPVGTTILAEHAKEDIQRAVVVFKQKDAVCMRQVIPILPEDIPAPTSELRPKVEPDDVMVLDWTLTYLVLYGIYKNFLTSSIQEFTARLKTASTAKIGAKQLNEELDMQQNTLRRARITEQIIELADQPHP